MITIQINSDGTASEKRIVLGNKYENNDEQIVFEVPEELTNHNKYVIATLQVDKDTMINKVLPVNNNVFHVSTAITHREGNWFLYLMCRESQLDLSQSNVDITAKSGEHVFISDGIIGVVNKNNINKDLIDSEPVDANLVELYEDLSELKKQLESIVAGVILGGYYNREEIDTKFEGVVKKDQGVDNGGKILAVGNDGHVELKDLSSVIENETYLMTESGSVAFLATPQAIESPLTATAKNDIRAGTVAITNEGIVVGEKNFPSYETTEGAALIMPNKEVKVHLDYNDTYDYTKLQAIVCLFNSNILDSVSAQSVAIDNGVYVIGTTNKISNITKEHETKYIDFGITNTGETPLVIRYFTYKEII